MRFPKRDDGLVDHIGEAGDDAVAVDQLNQRCPLPSFLDSTAKIEPHDVGDWQTLLSQAKTSLRERSQRASDFAAIGQPCHGCVGILLSEDKLRHNQERESAGDPQSCPSGASSQEVVDHRWKMGR